MTSRSQITAPTLAVIGIDLGESYSRVGVVREEVFSIIPDKQGQTAIPAYVSFPDHGEPLVGFEAKAQASRNPKNTIYDVRSLVGRNFSEPEVQEAIKELPYKVIDQDGQIKIKIHTNGEDKTVSPEEVLAMILQHLKIMAEEYLNSTISHAVIPVPCGFTEKQIQATKDAAFQGGLEAFYLRKKPISVGISHHLDLGSYYGRLENDQGNYMVYDAGDREVELSLVSTDRGVFDVMSTVRDESFRRNNFKTSKMEQQSVLAPSRIIDLVEKLLSESKLELNEVDDIVLSGDPLRTTEAQGVLESYFGKKVLAPIDFPDDQAVVYGAAIQGYSIITDEPDLSACGGLPMDVTPLALGIETSTGDFARVIPRHWVIPTRQSIIVSTAEDNQEIVTIRILEGAHKTASGNRELGTLNLTGLPRKPKGAIEINVSFTVDANGALYVSVGCEGRSEVEKLVVGARKYTDDEIQMLLTLNDLPTENDAREDNEGPVAVMDGVDLYHVEEKVTKTYFPWKFWKDTN